jgi:hypothetical protein
MTFTVQQNSIKKRCVIIQITLLKALVSFSFFLKGKGKEKKRYTNLKDGVKTYTYCKFIYMYLHGTILYGMI